MPLRLKIMTDLRTDLLSTKYVNPLSFNLPHWLIYRLVFLQVTGKSSVLAAALVIPFLLTAALSSIAMGHVATKFGLVRPPFLFGLAILPVGMVSRSASPI